MSEEELTMIAGCVLRATEPGDIYTDDDGNQTRGDASFDVNDFIAALDARGYRVVHK